MENNNSEENKNLKNEDAESQKSGTEPDNGTSRAISSKIAPGLASSAGLILIFILYQIGGSILTIAILGIHPDQADVTSLRLMTTSGQLLFILLPALMLTKYIYSDVTYVLRFRLPDFHASSLFVAGLLCLTPLLQTYMYLQNFFFMKIAVISPFFNKFKIYLDQFDKMVEDSYSAILDSHSVQESALIIIVVAVVPAVCEEIFFRGFVQRGFEFKFRPFRGALLTAVIFGFYHFHPYQIVPLAALGLYFGWAVYMSDSIFTSVLLHFLNNLFAVVLFFIFGKEDITVPQSYTATDLNNSVLLFLGLLTLFVLIIIYINRILSKKIV
ncbi:MAG: CPBP family intramembrane glutamic endopeptidase [Ignavibacteria bacterium]